MFCVVFLLSRQKTQASRNFGMAGFLTIIEGKSNEILDYFVCLFGIKIRVAGKQLNPAIYR